MTTNEVITNLENKAFHKSKKLTGVEQIILSTLVMRRSAGSK